jgi:hypothetical protein
VTTTLDRDTAWCEDLERLLRQRRIRLRSRRTTARSHVYVIDAPSGCYATVRVPRSAVAAGIYGLNAALAEIEDALSGASRNEAEWVQPSVPLNFSSSR